jgi:hypothetical protein
LTRATGTRASDIRCIGQSGVQNVRAISGLSIVAGGLGVFVAEAAAAPRHAAVAALYDEAIRLAVSAEEAERALVADAGLRARRDIVAGLEAVLASTSAGERDAVTPTRIELPR